LFLAFAPSLYVAFTLNTTDVESLIVISPNLPDALVNVDNVLSLFFSSTLYTGVNPGFIWTIFSFESIVSFILN